MRREKRTRRGPSGVVILVAAVAVITIAVPIGLYFDDLGKRATDKVRKDEVTETTAPPTRRWATDQELTAVRRAVSGDGILALGISRFHLRLKRYPRNLNELSTRPTDLAIGQKWTGPYINDPELLKDPWGQPYKYKYPGTRNPKSYDLWSIGPDAVNGTSDDIAEW